MNKGSPDGPPHTEPEPDTPSLRCVQVVLELLRLSYVIVDLSKSLSRERGLKTNKLMLMTSAPKHQQESVAKSVLGQ